jgi:hypothetical protein
VSRQSNSLSVVDNTRARLDGAPAGRLHLAHGRFTLCGRVADAWHEKDPGLWASRPDLRCGSCARDSRSTRVGVE